MVITIRFLCFSFSHVVEISKPSNLSALRTTMHSLSYSLSQALTVGDFSNFDYGHPSKHPMQAWIPLPSSPSHRSDKPKPFPSIFISSRHPHLLFASVAKGLMVFHLSDPLLLSGLVTPVLNDTLTPPCHLPLLACCWLGLGSGFRNPHTLISCMYGLEASNPSSGALVTTAARSWIVPMYTKIS